MDAVAWPRIVRIGVDQPRHLVQEGGVGRFALLAGAQRGRQARHLRGVEPDGAGDGVRARVQRRQVGGEPIRRRPSVGVRAQENGAGIVQQRRGGVHRAPAGAARVGAPRRQRRFDDDDPHGRPRRKLARDPRGAIGAVVGEHQHGVVGRRHRLPVAAPLPRQRVEAGWQAVRFVSRRDRHGGAHSTIKHET